MGTIALEVTDWNESRHADLPEVPDDITVSELIGEIRDAMSLAPDTAYELIYAGEKLNRSALIEETGVRSGDQLTIAPEVSAGRA
jgi:hypothetical protein